RGAYRYFTHKDNPEKYQYDERDIKVYNGFDISNHISFTKEEKYQAFTQIRQIIRDNNVTEYEELLDVLEKMDYNLLKVAYDNTHMLNAVLRSRRHKNRR
ncbi:Rep family protein, partial [Salinicoccus jeotgali]|uniref:Rep family protein n=1 Tax=Salinicoccus jeotgali TaxID=381634 RepID=UPI0031DA1031